MKRSHLALATMSMLACACRPSHTELPPYGEALLFVDTDLPVPQLAARLRVDLYSEEGKWFESRDIGRSDPQGWPASFSVFSDDETRDRRVLVRLRAYPEGITRPYNGERFAPRPEFHEPPVAHDRRELCANTPDLPVGARLTLREGSTKILDDVPASPCGLQVNGGSVAARVTISTKGTYRFSVAGTYPEYTWTTLMLRKACDDVSSQVACRSESVTADNGRGTGHFARFDADLDPGTYFVMTGGAAARWPADITLEVLPVDGPLPALDPPAAVVETDAPRLATSEAGRDSTPSTEPLPSATVDRLVSLHLRPGIRGSATIVLRGACAGTMAKLGADPTRPDPTTATTCTDQENVRVPLDDTPLVPELHPAYTSVQGTFGRGGDCDAGADPASEIVCVPGGPFLLGSRVQSDDVGTERFASPERIALMPRFWIDRHEVTVARFRQAVAKGLDVSAMYPNPQQSPVDPTVSPGDVGFCSWSTNPVGRENYAVSCISWTVARAFCQREGGDLPTEAEWEYVASAAGRPFKTDYPWGDEAPACGRAVSLPDACPAGGAPGAVAPPRDVTATDGHDGQPGDRSALGVAGLAGGVLEWALDSAQSYAGSCWAAATLESPRCWEADAPQRVLRGGSWALEGGITSGRAFLSGEEPGGDAPFTNPETVVGFRCAYRSAR
jgi:formylglycine-generating enzyme required for sulfatase activity